jgi:hypothetical protein
VFGWDATPTVGRGVRNHGTGPAIKKSIAAIPTAAMANTVVGGIRNNVAVGGAVRATVNNADDPQWYGQPTMEHKGHLVPPWE